VLSGISTADSVNRVPYCPHLVVESVADLVGRSDDPFGS
jgi:NagD protein